VLAIDVLRNYINRIPYLKLAGTFNNGIDALEYINSVNVDLVFMDIQMPDINGMDVLRLMHKKPNIVFTTAYPEHALEGYDFNPIDYLVKPISFEKFMRAISRVQSISNPMAPENAVSGSEYFYIKVNGKQVRLLLSDILYVEGLKDYVIFHTYEAQYVSMHGMKELEEKFPSEDFIRIHKSYIINIHKIQEVDGNQVKIYNRYIPVGRQFKSYFHKIIEGKKL
ncbi:MAG: response regulator transcription factor, partial [Cytophagales bacterium]|nr:response regulator transcription factor [Cytophaga sp.]